MSFNNINSDSDSNSDSNSDSDYYINNVDDEDNIGYENNVDDEDNVDYENNVDVSDKNDLDVFSGECDDDDDDDIDVFYKDDETNNDEDNNNMMMLANVSSFIAEKYDEKSDYIKSIVPMFNIEKIDSIIINNGNNNVCGNNNSKNNNNNSNDNNDNNNGNDNNNNTGALIKRRRKVNMGNGKHNNTLNNNNVGNKNAVNDYSFKMFITVLSVLSIILCYLLTYFKLLSINILCGIVVMLLIVYTIVNAKTRTKIGAWELSYNASMLFFNKRLSNPLRFKKIMFDGQIQIIIGFVLCYAWIEYVFKRSIEDQLQFLDEYKWVIATWLIIFCILMIIINSRVTFVIVILLFILPLFTYGVYILSNTRQSMNTKSYYNNYPMNEILESYRNKSNSFHGISVDYIVEKIHMIAKDSNMFETTIKQSNIFNKSINSFDVDFWKDKDGLFKFYSADISSTLSKSMQESYAKYFSIIDQVDVTCPVVKRINSSKNMINMEDKFLLLMGIIFILIIVLVFLILQIIMRCCISYETIDIRLPNHTRVSKTLNNVVRGEIGNVVSDILMVVFCIIFIIKASSYINEHHTITIQNSIDLRMKIFNESTSIRDNILSTNHQLYNFDTITNEWSNDIANKICVIEEIIQIDRIVSMMNIENELCSNMIKINDGSFGIDNYITTTKQLIPEHSSIFEQFINYSNKTEIPIRKICDIHAINKINKYNNASKSNMRKYFDTIHLHSLSIVNERSKMVLKNIIISFFILFTSLYITITLNTLMEIRLFTDNADYSNNKNTQSMNNTILSILNVIINNFRIILPMYYMSISHVRNNRHESTYPIKEAIHNIICIAINSFLIQYFVISLIFNITSHFTMLLSILLTLSFSWYFYSSVEFIALNYRPLSKNTCINYERYSMMANIISDIVLLKIAHHSMMYIMAVLSINVNETYKQYFGYTNYIIPLLLQLKSMINRKQII